MKYIRKFNESQHNCPNCGSNKRSGVDECPYCGTEYESKTLVFPQSFKKIPHRVITGAWQWKATKPNGTEISIVGGGEGLYGDGISTFEMWDYDEEEPIPHMTIEEINQYLSSL